MSVYVDPLFKTGRTPSWPYRWACHMYADTLEELHWFARKLGLPREWFQEKPGQPRRCHYDLTRNRRSWAIGLGAIPHTRRQAVRFWLGPVEAERLLGKETL